MKIYGSRTGSPRQALSRTTELDPALFVGLPIGVQQIFEAFCVPLISSVQASNLFDLVELARKIHRDAEVLDGVWFNMGYGIGTSTRVALRLPVYVLPILQVYNRLSQLGLPKNKTRLYSAHTMKILAGEKEDVAWMKGVRNLAITASFIHTFFPCYQDWFTYDLLLPVDDSIQNILANLVQQLHQIGGEDVFVAEAIRQLEQMGGNNGSRVSPLVYAAAHAPANFDLKGSPSISRFILPGNAHTMVTFGGSPERIFNILRTALRQAEAHPTRGAISLLAEVGQVPVYSCRDSEPTFDTADLSLKHLGPLKDNLGSSNKPEDFDLGVLLGAVDPERFLCWARHIQACIKRAQASSPNGLILQEYLWWLVLQARGKLPEDLESALNPKGGIQQLVESFRSDPRPL